MLTFPPFYEVYRIQNSYLRIFILREEDGGRFCVFIHQDREPSPVLISHRRVEVTPPAESLWNKRVKRWLSRQGEEASSGHPGQHIEPSPVLLVPPILLRQIIRIICPSPASRIDHCSCNLVEIIGWLLEIQHILV